MNWVKCIRCENPRTRKWVNEYMRDCKCCGLVFNINGDTVHDYARMEKIARQNHIIQERGRIERVGMQRPVYSVNKGVVD